MAEPTTGATPRQAGLGLVTLSALVVANMVGAGVFTSSGYSLEALGNPGRVMLAWWLCGVWAVCGALAYGALARRLPLSGGEYLFLSRLVHPAIGFLAGWISVVAGFTAPIAVAAQGAAIYLQSGSDSSDWRLTAIAVSVIIAAAACHLIGVSLGTGLQNAIVAAKLVLLVIVIAWAFLGTSTADWQGTALPGRNATWWPEDLSAWTVLVGSMSWVALSYTGFNAAIYVSGQSRNARQNVPRAMLLSTIMVTILYLLLNYVFVYAPQPESIANQNNVAAIAASAIGGSRLSGLVRATIVLSMISSVFAMLLAGPRVYQKMAEDGVMPRLFRADDGNPRLATAAQALLSIIAVFMADLLQLMKYLGLTLSACGALAVLSLWWARRRLPDAQPLRWWETMAMTAYLLITFAILWASRLTHADEFFAMLITFGLGALVYLLWVARDVQREDASAQHYRPYTIDASLSHGRVYDSYLAHCANDAHPIVLKVLPASRLSPLNRLRFQRECELLTKVDSDFIPRLITAGETVDGALYLAREHIPGQTLWELIQRDGPLPTGQSCELLIQIASGLDSLHAQGYLHGDLSPKNIIVVRVPHTKLSARPSIKLIDFGLSQISEELAETTPALVSGTPAFMSPETCRAQGPATCASDIYSFGCVAFFMLTGKPPFSGATPIEVCWKQLHATPPSPTTVALHPIAPELEQLVVHCLDKAPTARPTCLTEVVQILNQVQQTT